MIKYVIMIIFMISVGQSVVEISTSSNISDIISQIQAMHNTCAASPITNLKLCNNTCNSCLATNTYKCANCFNYFYLKGQDCLINKSISNYYYYNYFYDQSEATLLANLENFTYQDSALKIGKDKIIHLCGKPNSTLTNPFEFYMFGLFKSVQVVVLTYNHIPDGIDKIYIKLNILSVVQSMTFFIDVNGINRYKQAATTFSDLQGVYARNTTVSAQGQSYLNLDALSYDTVGSVIVSVTLPEVDLISQGIKIRFYAQTPGNEQKHTWGMHDIVVVMRKCQSCVSRRLQELINQVGTATGYLFLVVLVTIIILFILIAIQDFLRKRKFEKKLGSSSGNLPIKAINRVIHGIQKHLSKRNRAHYVKTKQSQQQQKQSNKIQNNAMKQQKEQ